MSFQLKGICFQICVPPMVAVIIAERSLWNIQQGLGESPVGSAREVLTLLWKSGVM